MEWWQENPDEVARVNAALERWQSEGTGSPLGEAVPRMKRPVRTLEVVSLEGIDLDGTPPCEMTIPGRKLCGKPSFMRVQVTCSCGTVRLRFVCKSCYPHLGSLITMCCGSREYSWRAA